MSSFLLGFLQVTLTTSLIIAVILTLSYTLRKHYKAKWEHIIWLVMAVRLLVPFSFALPNAPFNIAVPSIQMQTASSLSTSSLPVSSIPTPSSAQIKSGTAAVPVHVATPKSANTVNQPIQDPQNTPLTIFDWTLILIVIWAVGFAIFVSFQTIVYQRFMRTIKKHGSDLNDVTVAETIKNVTNKMGIKARFRTIVCNEVRSPMMTGIFRPVLLLPHIDYPQDILQNIIIHELTHFRRKDLWFKFLLFIVNAIYWFNPLVWIMCRRASINVELCCDDSIITGKNATNRKLYGEMLLAAVNSQPNNVLFSTNFRGGVKQMKTRFINIMATEKRRLGLAIFGLMLVLLITVCSMVGCNPAAKTVNNVGSGTDDNSSTSSLINSANSALLTSSQSASSSSKASSVVSTKAPSKVASNVPAISSNQPIKTISFKNAPEVENISDKLLIALAQHSQVAINGLYQLNDFGVKLEKGEFWQAIETDSASTPADAKNIVTTFALLQKPISYTIDYIGENQYYYSYRLRYTVKEYADATTTITYTIRTVVYKESAKHCAFNSHTGYSAKFITLDPNSVLQLLDLEVVQYMSPLNSSNVLYRDFNETNNEYIYTVYYIIGSRGDWGMSDTATLYKTVIRVNKKTGEYTPFKAIPYKQHIQLKTVTLPGTKHSYPY